MSKYESSLALAEKAEWEGGIGALIFGYGLPVEDLPDDLPSSVRDAILRVIAVDRDLEYISEHLSKVQDEADHTYPTGLSLP